MVRNFILLTLIAIFGAIVLGFLGFLHPAFDTASNFRAHLSGLLFVVAIIWLTKYRKIIGVMFMVIAAVSFYSITIVGVSVASFENRISNNQSSTYRLLSLNLFYKNSAPEKVLELIAKTNADILALSEVSDPWKERLKFLIKQYRYSFYCPEWRSRGGTIIYSRFKFSGQQEYCHSYAALALRDFEIDGVKIGIGAVHTRWPWPASGPRQVRNMKSVLQSLGPDALIAGDFNSTTWSQLVRNFASYGSLKIISGVGPTWIFELLPGALIQYLGLPIDNVMAKGKVLIKDARTLQPAGSDHLPILIDFQIEK